METKSLKKSISFVQTISLVIGTIIGSGIFLKSGIVFKNAGSPMKGILAWIIGGVVTLCSALTIAEIAGAIPKSGGLYVYLEELYGEKVGFLLGWVQSIISYPASTAALAIAFAGFASFFVKMTDTQTTLLAIGVLLLVLFMNILSTKYGGIIQTVSTIGKLVPIVLIILVGFFKGEVGSPISTFSAVGNASLGAAVLGTLWAYDGWIGATNVADEMKNPKKDLPKALILGVSSVIAVYCIFNFVILKVLSFDGAIASAEPATDVAIKLFGTMGGTFIVIGIMVSVFGTLNGYLMTGGRVPFVMGTKGQLPFSNFLGKVHPKFSTPSNALIVQAVLSIAYICSGSFETLTNMLVFVLWIFFVLGVISIFILRKKSKNGEYKQDGYKVPLYPIVPLIGIVGGIYILGSTIMDSPMNSIIGIVITLLGLPVFFYIKSKNKDKSTN